MFSKSPPCLHINCTPNKTKFRMGKNPCLQISYAPNHLVSVSKRHGYVHLNTKLSFTCRFYQHSDDPLKCGCFLRWFLFSKILLPSIHQHPPTITVKERISKQPKSPAVKVKAIIYETHAFLLQEMGKHSCTQRNYRLQGRIRNKNYSTP